MGMKSCRSPVGRMGILALILAASLAFAEDETSGMSAMTDREKAEIEALRAASEEAERKEQAQLESVAEKASEPEVVSGAEAGEPAAELAEAVGVPVIDDVERGKKLYQSGDYALALDRLEGARRRHPDDPQAALLLGLTHLRMDRLDDTLEDWSDFREHTADAELSREIGQHMTILLHEASHRAAQEALAAEARLSAARTSPRSVAVGPFRNLGSPEYAPLGKALASMLIDNLQGLPDVTVLEREQVQALVDEANLAESGLVEKSTAVRAGKLLRAGRMAAGSHVDFTASPTQLRVQAVLVAVDDATELASKSESDEISKFYTIIPKIASSFAPVLTGTVVAQLPADVSARIGEPHTRSLEAAVAYGEALDAIDREDPEAAREQCRKAEQADPDFELAKRFCAFVPPVWLSPQAVASAVEAAAFAAPTSLASQTAPWVIGGLVVGGAAAGAAIAASGDGDGDGDGDVTSDGNNPPGVSGVPGAATVVAGDTITYQVSSNDPDGDRITLVATQLPPGASFTQTAGVVATGTFSFRPNQSHVGRTFTFTVCARDQRRPPGETCASSNIQVISPTPTPGAPTPTPTPTPIPCVPLGDGCELDFPGECCSETCELVDDVPTCCIGLGDSGCGTPGECCSGNTCDAGTCCFQAGGTGFCNDDFDCCGAAVCGTGSCCLPEGEECNPNLRGEDCCSGSCNSGNFCQGLPA